MSGCTCRPFIPVCTGSGSGMQNPLANFIGVFSLVRDDRGFQVNPLCRHDITSPFPPSGNGGCVRNLDVPTTTCKYSWLTMFLGNATLTYSRGIINDINLCVTVIHQTADIYATLLWNSSLWVAYKQTILNSFDHLKTDLTFLFTMVQKLA